MRKGTFFVVVQISLICTKLNSVPDIGFTDEISLFATKARNGPFKTAVCRVNGNNHI